MSVAETALPDPYRYALADIREFLDDIPSAWDAQERLGSSIEAHESVPAALYSFLRHPESFENAVEFAVRLGDDTDTVGAMTGAIAGAFHGYRAIPAKWLRPLENGAKGRDYLSRWCIRACGPDRVGVDAVRSDDEAADRMLRQAPSPDPRLGPDFATQPLLQLMRLLRFRHLFEACSCSDGNA